MIVKKNALKLIHFLLLIFLYMQTIHVHAIIRKSDLEKMNLTGAVSNLKETEYEMVTDQMGNLHLSQQLIHQEYEFNELGMILRWADVYVHSGTVSGYYINSYSTEGDILNHIYYGGDDSKITTTEYFYDDKRQLIYWHMKDKQDSVIYLWKNEFDKRGNIIYSASITGGKTDRSYVYKYNKENLKILEKWFYGEDSCVFINQTKYLKKGEYSSKSISTCNGKPCGISLTKKSADNLQFDNLSYDSKQAYSNSKPDERSCYKYNSNGHCISIETYNSSNELTDSWSWEYEYDDRSNWISCTKFHNGEALKRTMRVITYRS